MDDHAEVPAERCLRIARRLNEANDWGLSTEELTSYTQAIGALASEQPEDDLLERILVYYHLEHATVEALRDTDHFNHSLVWQAYMEYVTAIMFKRYSSFQSGGPELDDVKQNVLIQVMKSLRAYRYESSLKTWVYEVVSRQIVSQIRVHRTQGSTFNRSASSLDDPDSGSWPAAPDNLQPETLAQDRDLLDLVESVLRAHGDRRLHTIFMLRSVAGFKINDIQQILNLSQPQTSRLWQKACNYLREHPSIQAWHHD